MIVQQEGTSAYNASPPSQEAVHHLQDAYGAVNTCMRNIITLATALSKVNRETIAALIAKANQQIRAALKKIK